MTHRKWRPAIAFQRWMFSIVSGLLVASGCGATPSAQRPTALPTARVLAVTRAPLRVQVRLVATATPPSPPKRAPTQRALPSVFPATFTPLPPTNTPVPPTSTPMDEIAARETQLVQLINDVRAANALPAYQPAAELSAAARAHSCDIAAHHIISHDSSDGHTLQERLPSHTPPWVWPSESILAGTDDPAQVVALWMDEPPDGWHRRNILDPQQHYIGVGYCYIADDPSGNHHYWTADFARYD